MLPEPAHVAAICMQFQRDSFATKALHWEPPDRMLPIISLWHEGFLQTMTRKVRRLPAGPSLPCQKTSEAPW
jgi:hypothetical protein